MRTTRGWLGAVMVTGLLVLLPSCIKSKLLLVIYPDSSGKLEVSMGINKDIAALGNMGEEGESATPSTTDLTEESEGITWVMGEEFEEGDFKFSKVTGYFEDINEVKLKDQEYSFTKLEDGSYQFTFVDKSATEKAKEEDPPEEGEEGEKEEETPEEKAMGRAVMKAMLAGFELSYTFKMPGEVTEAEGLELSGREAKLKIDADKFMDLMEKADEVEKGISGKILAKPEGDLTGEMAAFRKEMEEAKVKAAEQEAKRKAAEDKKKAEEEAKKHDEGAGEESKGEGEEKKREESGEEEM